MSKLQTLLNRLEHVRKHGEGYRAKCPCHGGTNKSSLSVCEKEDGRILLYCHSSECPAIDILESIGLKFSDIMPERLNHRATPEQRRKWKQDAIHRDWAEFVTDLVHESRIVWVAGRQMRNTEPLNDNDNDRLDLAMVRMQRIGEYFNGQR